MKTLLTALTAPLLAGAMHIQSAHAELQRQPTREVSVALGLGTLSESPSEELFEERLRERLYGSGSEEWLEERVREQRGQRGYCYRIVNSTEREGCFEDLEADPK